MLLRYKEAILYIIFIMVIFIFAITKTYPKIIETIDVEKNIGEKSAQAISLEDRLNTLKARELEKSKINGQIKKIYKPELSGIDAESSFAVLFDDLIDMAKYNGVKIYSVTYTYNPPEDAFVKGAGGIYNVCQLNMDVISDYTDLESFLKELYKYPYLINIQKIELTPYPKNKRILLTSLQIKLYTTK